MKIRTPLPRLGSAAAAVTRIVELARTDPGPLGALKALHIAELQHALASYLQEAFPGEFGPDELVEMGRAVIVHHQALHHATFTALDTRAGDEPLDEVLLRMALDHALDCLVGRQNGHSAPLPATTRDDDGLVAMLFGRGSTTLQVRRALLVLFQAGRKRDFRIVETCLELAERWGRPPTDEEVQAACGVTGVTTGDVKRAMLGFANRMGAA